MTPNPNPTLGPVAQSNRIQSLDVIRGIALLGILLMNIVGFGLAFAYFDPTNAGGSTGWNFRVWFINNMLFEGTMRGLFTMLFGAGFILLTMRAEQKGGGIEVADIYYRRILWLLLFGVIHVYLLLWHGDILYPYAVFGLMLFPVRNVQPKYLMIAGLILLSVYSYKSYLHYQEDLATKTEGVIAQELKDSEKELTEEQQGALKKYEEFQNRKKTPEDIKEENEAMHKGYWSIVKYKTGLNQFMQSTLLYEVWVWDILSMMLIGIAFYKWGVFQNERSTRFYLLLMIVGYGIGLTVNYFEMTSIYKSDYDVLIMSKVDITYQLGRLFTTFGHIGLAILFVRTGILGFLQKALAAVGKMALTNYLMQTIICNVFFLGFGFGMFGKLQRYELYYLVFAIWLFQLIYSPIWFRYFRFGPAEWMWRSLIYLKKQPFRKRIEEKTKTKSDDKEIAVETA